MREVSDYLILRPEKRELEDEELPLVSFVIPVRNAERTIRKCLESIFGQDYPRIEVLVIDNGCTDGTMRIASEFSIRAYALPHKTYGECVLFGIREARGELVVVFDGDMMLPHERWLRNAVCKLMAHGDASTLYTPNIPPPGASSFTQFYTDLARLIVMDRMRRSAGVFGGGGGSMIRRACILSVMPTAVPADGVDFVLARRLKEGGWKVVVNDEPVLHDTRASLKEWIRKEIRRSRIFVRHGVTNILGLSLNEVLYEQLVLPLRNLPKKLFVEKRPCWALLPLFLAVRIIAYGLVSLSHLRG